MNYFCDVNLQSRQDQQRRIFVVLPDIADGDQPKMTKEILADNNQFKEFWSKYKPKMVLAEYALYSTEAAVFASSQDEVFTELIDSGNVQLIGRSELMIDGAEKKMKSKRSGKKKKKTSPLLILAAAVGILIISASMFTLGKKSSGNVVTTETNAPAAEVGDDGMIIPVQESIDENAEQITISIDRSYSAVPTEDLQLKGVVVEGKATITLPEFDKTDFFSHVPGHTWGFTSDPEGKKIEYYSGRAYEFTKDTKLYRVLVKYGGGNGTKDDPYLIDYYDQLELMGEEQARGYFMQTSDIAFPDWAAHTPINTVNELKSDPEDEYFEFNGSGYTISNLTSPLFGKVSGATIKNVNIINSAITSTEYKDYGFIVCNALNYKYEAENGKTYETGETLIQHCSVSHSSINARYPETDEPVTEVVTAPVVVPPDLIEYDEEGNPIETTVTIPAEPDKRAEYSIGAISGNGGEIDSCYVTDFGIFAYLNDYFLYAGGISGKPANVTNCAVFYFSAQGNIFNAGGIAGSGSGSRMYNPMGIQLPECYGGNIKGCTARRINLCSENSGGGIVGEGSSSASNAIISNCYANELTMNVGEFADVDRTELKKAGSAGGIIGTDGNELNGHLIMNTVSPADFLAVGKASKSKYDDSIRLAPAYAYYQENILTVINKNTINPQNPKEIFTGSFKFGDSTVFGDDSGSLPYPENIEDLFEKTVITEEEKND